MRILLFLLFGPLTLVGANPLPLALAGVGMKNIWARPWTAPCLSRMNQVKTLQSVNIYPAANPFC